MVTVRIRVEGKVQGVFYRQTTRDKARQLKLTGWVKNLEDGAVLIEACGSQEVLEELVSWSWCGPPMANVTRVETEWLECEQEATIEPSSSFHIRT